MARVDWSGRRRRPASAACLLPLLIGLAGPGTAARAPEESAPERAAPPRAVVLITIDTLRADHVSFNGYGRTTTPYLDSLAEHGAVFESAYAPSSWTPPSMATLFTGLYPTSHGIHYGEVADGEDSIDVFRQPRLPESLVTLAERLRGAGYRTFGVQSNLHLSSRLGFAQGFDHFAEPGVFPAAPEVNSAVRLELEAIFGRTWREAWRAEKTFLWIHYFDPHDPYFARRPWIDRYAPDFGERESLFPAGLTLHGIHESFPDPSPEVGARLKPLYDSEISFLDDRLRELGGELSLDAPEVLLVVTSDHGEGLVDRGRVGHGNGLWQEEVHVPLLLRWTGGRVPAARLSAPVGLIDVLPTVLDLVGEQVPDGLAGTSLAGILRGGAVKADRSLYFEVEPSNPPFLTPLPPSLAVLEGGWKLIRERRPGARSLLFDLSSDPGERRDLASEMPGTVLRLERSLRDWLDHLPPPPGDLERVPLENEELRKRLEALGYVGGR